MLWSTELTPFETGNRGRSLAKRDGGVLYRVSINKLVHTTRTAKAWISP
jgi:hypothetical protein